MLLLFNHLSATDEQPVRKGNKKGYILPLAPSTPFSAYISAQAIQKEMRVKVREAN